ncbi:MAG: glutamate--tRNA ligase [Kiritimatiellia bacterium]
MKVRTRIAPSPTGAPHIGTAYIALFNRAFAKHHGGQFILRIEDTDQVRSTRESEAAIFDALRWLGLDWDEGPDVGGAFGPYRQSERTAIYREHAERLVASGHAYPCFCTTERLAELRQMQEANQTRIGYDGHCAGLDAAAAAQRVASGEPHVIRLRTPPDGVCQITDRFRGVIDIAWETVDDQILVKADGFPTYHLANVVDDHLMEITHVIRGEEWISSAPKHLLLYEAFGWEPPVLAHLPLLRNPDKSKLSKRKNPTGILYYRQAGFLPQAILNYLGLMAYRPEGDLEIFDFDTMVASFALDRVSLGGPIFDIQKLRAFNGHYIRELQDAELLETLKGWLLQDGSLLGLVRMAKPRLEQLADFVPMTAYMFADQVTLDPADIDQAGKVSGKAAEWVQFAQWEFERLSHWEAEDIRGCLSKVAECEGVKFKLLLGVFFRVFSGRAVALPLFETLVWLGRDMTLRRLQYAQEALREAGVGLSGKALKRLEKSYQERYFAEGGKDG